MKKVRIEKPLNFDITQTFDCGQCFRFNKAGENTYEGVALGKYIKVEQSENSITFYNTDASEFENIWSNYFDFNTDYAGIINSFKDDRTLKTAAEYSSGIRILRQDMWETLCSFIISQNNNIPRIKGIIERMSEKYGEIVWKDGDKKYYSFPDAKTLLDAGEKEIFDLKTGFRAKYIFDCANTICSQPFFLTDVNNLSTPEASLHLQKIKGVGAKVAACTLLFGYARHDAFPVDVWVKRILEKYYPDGENGHLTGKYAGIAQQYLFYYERCSNGVFL